MLFRSALTTMAFTLLTLTTSSVNASPVQLKERGLFDGGINDWNCKPQAPHNNPVVLVHGLGAPSGVLNFGYMAPRLAAKGYCTFALDYGRVPQVPLLAGLDLIENSAQQLSDFVDKVLVATGAAKVDIVGHSEGTMMPRYYLKFLGGNLKVDRFAGFGSNAYGTTLQGLVPLVQKLGLWDPVLKVISPFCKSCPQLVQGSPFVAALNAGGDSVPGVKYLVIASQYDEVVNPYTNGFLRDQNPNVRNVVLQDLCMLSIAGHITQAASPLVFNAVHAFLSPSVDQTINCLDMIN